MRHSTTLPFLAMDSVYWRVAYAYTKASKEEKGLQRRTRKVLLHLRDYIAYPCGVNGIRTFTWMEGPSQALQFRRGHYMRSTTGHLECGKQVCRHTDRLGCPPRVTSKDQKQ